MDSLGRVDISLMRAHLGQYRANISVQLRHHMALPGRCLELGRRFFRSF